ncbi:MAG: aryl-sulfate sulfotransferase [Planctomycetota bacterium]|jgi:hypothetical protein
MTRTRLDRLSLLCLSLAAFSVAAQSQSPAEGHRVYSPMNGTNTLLVDDQGATVHTWPSSSVAGNTVYVEDDGVMLRAIRTGVSGPGGGTGGGIERLALDGIPLWSFDYDTGGNIHHHDVESLPNGNVLLVAWETKTQAEAIAAGRNPALVTGASFFPDHIIEVQQTGPTSGAIVWEWHVWDHLIQDFDPGKANFGDPAAHPELIDINFPATNTADFNHVNSVDYDAANDWVLISANFQDEFWIVDHSTTTAEAAGHTGGDHGKGGDLLYRWGNPQAYRAGTGADQKLFRQHGVKFIGPGLPGAGNVLLYNNQIAPTSRIEEIVLPIDGQGEFIFGPGGVYGPAAPVWTYQDPAMTSNIMSSADRLPGGNTLICSSLQGRIFEITTTGMNVWEIGTPTTFRATFVDRTLWSDGPTMSVSAGGSVAFELIAGSAQAGQQYFVLGSVSGTAPGFSKSGVHVPLNWDVYTDLSLALANTAILTDTFGLLDGSGRASASFNTTPGLIPPAAIGLVLHHVALAVDPGTSKLTWASNAVETLLEP